MKVPGLAGSILVAASSRAAQSPAAPKPAAPKVTVVNAADLLGRVTCVMKGGEVIRGGE